MTTETMTRGTPAGHYDEAPLHRIVTCESRVLTALDTWLDSDTRVWRPSNYDAQVRADYYRAQNLLENIECSVPEVEAAIVGRYDHPLIGTAGIFLSAAYAKVKAKDFVFALNPPSAPLICVGAFLPAGKSLVYRAKPSCDIGYGGQGIVIHDSEETSKGQYSRAAFVVNKNNWVACESDFCIDVGTRDRAYVFPIGSKMNFTDYPHTYVQPSQVVLDFTSACHSSMQQHLAMNSVLVAGANTGLPQLVELAHGSILIAATSDPMQVKRSDSKKNKRYFISRPTLSTIPALEKLINEVRHGCSGTVSECLTYLRSLGDLPGVVLRERMRRIMVRCHLHQYRY